MLVASCWSATTRACTGSPCGWPAAAMPNCASGLLPSFPLPVSPGFDWRRELGPIHRDAGRVARLLATARSRRRRRLTRSSHERRTWRRDRHPSRYHSRCGLDRGHNGRRLGRPHDLGRWPTARRPRLASPDRRRPQGVTIYDVAGRRAELLLLHGVRPLAAELERWRVFSDRRIPAGKSWRSHLGIRLESARCVIVVWSEHTAA